VIEPYCTGCELCIPVCPVDCIVLENVSGDATGWDAWSDTLAAQARSRYDDSRQRREHEPALDIPDTSTMAPTAHATVGSPGGAPPTAGESGMTAAERRRDVIRHAQAKARVLRER
jgi:electron transport complex protein RnfB